MEFLRLHEHKGDQLLARSALPAEAAETLWRRFGDHVGVTYPSPKTDFQWSLSTSGWVGYIPLTPDFGIALDPKVPIRNLFLMLEYAYALRKTGLKFPEGTLSAESLQTYYETLAHVLAKRVLSRARKGLYRAYVREADQLNCVRGRLEILNHLRSPWSVSLPCRFDEHTADVDENRILAWTLHNLSRLPLKSSDTRRDLRHAYRAVAGGTRLQPYVADDCIGRLYNRLNDDYEPLHSLCRFFLEQSGVSHRQGDRSMVPFLIHMPRLFELFVAEWLKAHLPDHLRVDPQHTVNIDPDRHLRFQIDLVIRERDTGRALCVLDTKYKDTTSPDSGDIAQVVAYAESQGCTRAALIYPLRQPASVRRFVGRIAVSALGFDVSSELELAGARMRHVLLDWLALSSRGEGVDGEE